MRVLVTGSADFIGFDIKEMHYWHLVHYYLVVRAVYAVN